MKRPEYRICMRRRQAGSTIAESVIGIMLVMMVGFGAAQWALIYHAKVMLDHAAFSGARAGAVRNADPDAISAGIARGLVPLYMPGTSMDAADAALFDRVIPDLERWGRLRILNPTQEAFDDFGATLPSGQEYIPNRYLSAHSPDEGSASGLNVQDANLLKIQVTYGYELNVPLAGQLMTTGMTLPILGTLMAPRGGYSAEEIEMLENGRLPIVASATVRMQSPPYRSTHMASRGELVTPE